MVGGVDIELTPALAQAVFEWRDRSGLTHDDVRAAGGPSSPTMTKIENADGTISPATAKKLEQAFGWQPGTVRELSEEHGDPVDFDSLKTKVVLTARIDEFALAKRSRALVDEQIERLESEPTTSRI